MSAEPLPPLDFGDISLILTDEFWERETAEMRIILLSVFLDVTSLGMETGAIQLVDAGLPPTNITTIDAAAQRYARNITDQILGAISKNNRAGVGAIVEGWIGSGEDKAVLAKRLKRFGDNNAKAIATTEVTRAFSAGQRMVWDQSGYVTARMWWAMEDERVCQICRSLHGTVIPLYERFTRLDRDENGELVAPNETAGSLLIAAGFELNPFGDPPAHVNCRCIMLPVTANFDLVYPSPLVLGIFNAFMDVALAAS